MRSYSRISTGCQCKHTSVDVTMVGGGAIGPFSIPWRIAVLIRDKVCCTYSRGRGLFRPSYSPAVCVCQRGNPLKIPIGLHRGIFILLIFFAMKLLFFVYLRGICQHCLLYKLCKKRFYFIKRLLCFCIFCKFSHGIDGNGKLSPLDRTCVERNSENIARSTNQSTESTITDVMPTKRIALVKSVILEIEIGLVILTQFYL